MVVMVNGRLLAELKKVTKVYFNGGRVHPDFLLFSRRNFAQQTRTRDQIFFEGFANPNRPPVTMVQPRPMFGPILDQLCQIT